VLAFGLMSDMFRAAASCRRLCDAVNATDYCAFCNIEHGDWVYIDGLANKSYNAKCGQVVSHRLLGGPGQTRRLAVAVDGCLGDIVNREGSTGLPRYKMYKKVSLPWNSLTLLTSKIMGVRLHAFGEAALPQHLAPDAAFIFSDVSTSGLFTISTIQIPARLSCFPGGSGDSLVMSRAGLPLSVREIEPSRRLVDNGADCELASYLRGWDEKMLRNYSLSHALQPIFPIAPKWQLRAGPHIVSRVDGSDFTIEDMKLVWAFVQCQRWLW